MKDIRDCFLCNRPISDGDCEKANYNCNNCGYFKCKCCNYYNSTDKKCMLKENKNEQKR